MDEKSGRVAEDERSGPFGDGTSQVTSSVHT